MKKLFLVIVLAAFAFSAQTQTTKIFLDSTEFGHNKVVWDSTHNQLNLRVWIEPNFPAGYVIQWEPLPDTTSIQEYLIYHVPSKENSIYQVGAKVGPYDTTDFDRSSIAHSEIILDQTQGQVYYMYSTIDSVVIYPPIGSIETTWWSNGQTIMADSIKITRLQQGAWSCSYSPTQMVTFRIYWKD